MGAKKWKCEEWGFGTGNLVSFDLALRNAELSPSDPKHRNLLTLRSGPEPGTDFRFELPAKFGAGRSKLGVPGHVYPEIKGQWLIFLKVTNGVF